jgi:hypothetical protein
LWPENRRLHKWLIFGLLQDISGFFSHACLLPVNQAARSPAHGRRDNPPSVIQSPAGNLISSSALPGAEVLFGCFGHGAFF